MEKSPKQVGRPKGSRNRVVINARRAIADFVESNIPRFNGWLNQIAEGIPKRDSQGKKLVDAQGSTVFIVKPDPAQALKLVADVCEYHLPRLMRSDVAVVAQIEHRASLENIRDLPTDVLRARLLERLGMSDGPVIDVTPDPVQAEQVPADPLPDWLKAD